ncbi:T9SS type A sorting domain-containing protein [Flavobacterium aquicola]|uniref:Putative secreted protein (Por secretion system target) n=1 Tax=Flavobacterium aquicola TaxID=1682742 RepID=A0A3E0EDQ6_9FLAO|nr:T9SS type A sorting domain-containing protein [Flavobacterium aquicola]REG96375.1 putative secreted protein (Por secretion system target) [Flavobacterium aquicola]
MKKILLFILFPILNFGQTKIGANIDGEPIASYNGRSVSLSSNGNTLAVGAPGNDQRGNETGYVHVFQNVSGEWTRLGFFVFGEAAGDNSGYSTSLSADGVMLAVGSPYNDGNGTNAGSVRVYIYSGNSWDKIGNDIDGEAAGDNSGTSISLSGDGSTVAVGSPYNDGNGTDAGSVRVYQRNVSGIWTKIGADIDGEAAGDNSGTSVSLSTDGTTLAVGSPRNDGSGIDAGSVRIYKYISGTWTQIGTDIDGEAAGDNSGTSISLSSDGDALAIGANGNDGNGSDAGSVRVYKNVSGTWTKTGADLDGEAAGDNSGASVSLSSDGNTLAIGVPLNDGSGAEAGSARIYKYISDTWTQIGTDIDGEAAGDNSGTSISLSGDGTTLAIGAPLNDGSGTDAGCVRGYKNVSGTWTKIGVDINKEFGGGFSGKSVSVSGDGSTVAIGAVLSEANGFGYQTGSVRVYKNVSGIWTKIGDDLDGEASIDYCGWSVSLSYDGTILAIGSYANDTSGDEAGSVRVYQNISGIWTQIGASIGGEALYDDSGWSVSLSDDGTVVAIGAPYNDAKGNATGSVRVYKNILGTWTKIGADIDGEEAGDNSGASISLSGDGTILAIGASYNSGSGRFAGSVRVYKNVSDTWTQIGADIDGEAAEDRSGYSVSLSRDGTTVAIGAPYNRGGTNEGGSVRVYKNVLGTWTKIGADIDGETYNDNSGWSVSLSSDGTVLAIGTPHNAGNGVQSGSVRVYQNISGTWTKIGTDIDGERAGDYSGISISISGNGTTLAIGSPANDDSGDTVGSVRVFDLSALLETALSSDSFVLANFSVYPNPASELVNISLQEDLILEKVNVYNIIGKLVKTEKKSVISVSSLAKGNYFFEVITNKGKAVKKIIVQ